tara:strand:+ start:254 stop:448 length:195 start_codon:yes stop_codon:yes gene_type:complete
MQIDGVTYDIDWCAFQKGTSFTIPCLDCAKAKAEVQRMSDRMQISIHTKVVIEDGIRALRVWRM